MTVAVLLIAVAWLVTPRPVPLYDGVGLPDEPYRYVHAPAGARVTPAPTGATARSSVAKGLNITFLNAFSAESGPQVTVNLPDGGVAAASGPVTVRILALAPVGQPPGTSVDGNVYQVEISSPGGAVHLTPAAADGAVYLRAPRQIGKEVMLYRTAPGLPWRGLPTQQAGNDVWGAVPPGLGQFALAARAPLVYGPSAAGSGAAPAAVRPGRFPVAAAVLLGVLAVLAALVLLIRRRARHLPTST